MKWKYDVANVRAGEEFLLPSGAVILRIEHLDWGDYKVASLVYAYPVGE